MWHRHLSKFYCSTVFSDISIEKRIKAFAEMDLRLPQRAYPIVSPPYLTESNTKSILQFVSTHKIPNNVRILHALAHIEYNAFMSYADTVIRFRQQTQPYQIQFQSDVRAVALEQGHHFSLLKNRLQALGFHYGSIPVIPKLSLAIQQSNNSLLERIALISLVHQGRGMKAVEKLLGQLHKEKDTQSVDIVKIIRNDESRHFMIGWKWFLRICMLKNIDPGEKIAQLNAKYRTDMRLPDQPQAKE